MAALNENDFLSQKQAEVSDEGREGRRRSIERVQGKFGVLVK